MLALLETISGPNKRLSEVRPLSYTTSDILCAR